MSNKIIHTNNKEEIDISKFIEHFKSEWKLLTICTVVFLLLGISFLRYFSPLYKVHAKVLVLDDNESGNALSVIGGNSMKAFGDLFGVKSNVDNEVEVLEAANLISKVVRDNNLFVKIHRPGTLKNIELFSKAPIDVQFLSLNDSIKEQKINLKIFDKNSFFLESDDELFPNKIHFNDTIHSVAGKFIVRKTGINFDYNSYIISVKSIDETADALASDLSVEVTSKETTIMGLEFKTSIPKKGEFFLSKLIDAYRTRNLLEKNKISDSTIVFLDKRIAIVKSELNDLENQLQSFKEKNRIFDIPSQSKSLVDASYYNYNKSKELQVQLEVVNNMLEMVKSSSKSILPHIANSDPTFLTLIQNYNALILQRERMLLSVKEGNPLISNVDNQISSVRADMIKNLTSQQTDLSIASDAYQKEVNQNNQRVYTLPSLEKSFVGLSRERDVKQALYLFLLQQREETAISKASNFTNASIIDGPKSEFKPYFPKTIIVFILSVLSALLFTMFWILWKNLFSNKIISKQDIQNLTDCPLIAEIGHSSNEGMLLDEDGRSVISEEFRQLRTNLSFAIGDKTCPKILITSTISGEGKSFISFNIANIYAKAGKKVLLIEMDLRKPKLSSYLGVDNSQGLTSFIISKQSISNYLVPIVEQENLFFLSSGPIPPNPAELLMAGKIEELFVDASKMFDYIIIDSPPLGLVTDAQIIAKYSDVNLYVIRCNLSFKKSFDLVNNLVQSNQLRNLYIILNDVSSKFRKYGYGYGYGYGLNKKKRTFQIKKFFTQ